MAKKRAQDLIGDAIAAMSTARGAKRTQMRRDLGRVFLTAVEEGDIVKTRRFIDDNFPVNYQDPQTGETALHIAAGCRARKVLRALLESNKCDFLIRDTQGRLPSEIAYLYGEDPAVARLLGIKERKQAAEKGIKLTRRP